MKNLLICTSLLAAAPPTSALAQAEGAAPEIVQSFEVRVPAEPRVSLSVRKPQLVYELHLTNFSSRPLKIEEVSVLDVASGTVLATARSLHDNRALEGAPAGLLPPRQRAVLYLDIALTAPAPRAIGHRIVFWREGAANDGPKRLTTPSVPVDSRRPPLLGAPLRGGPWAAVYDPLLERGHRRAVYAVAGAARIPGRFAIDWFKLDHLGRSKAGDSARPDSHHGYGADVLAVADGVVVAARDDVAEPTSTTGNPPVRLGDATGAYVALDIGHGRYAFYEHLRPGLKVRVGDRVRRGQVIGGLGFTGQASAPHLHFHIADRNSPLDAEGLPYSLADVEILGSYPSIDAVGRGPWDATVAEAPAGPLFPGPNMVVNFPGGASGGR